MEKILKPRPVSEHFAFQVSNASPSSRSLEPCCSDSNRTPQYQHSCGRHYLLFLGERLMFYLCKVPKLHLFYRFPFSFQFSFTLALSCLPGFVYFQLTREHIFAIFVSQRICLDSSRISPVARTLIRMFGTQDTQSKTVTTMTPR